MTKTLIDLFLCMDARATVFQQYSQISAIFYCFSHIRAAVNILSLYAHHPIMYFTLRHEMNAFHDIIRGLNGILVQLSKFDFVFYSQTVFVGRC